MPLNETIPVLETDHTTPDLEKVAQRNKRKRQQADWIENYQKEKEKYSRKTGRGHRECMYPVIQKGTSVLIYNGQPNCSTKTRSTPTARSERPYP